jgi:predicted DNA-binding transcriptional regulator AlpA
MEMDTMVRKVMRLPAVLAATGWAKPTLYAKIADGKFPKGTKLDPDARAVVWWEDEVEAFQKAAVAAALEAA